MSVGVDPYARTANQGVPTMAAVAALTLAVFCAIVGRAAGLGEVDEVETFVLIFSSIVVEALPFILLGALVSAAIAV